MALTNFPNGISSFGIPTFGAGGLLPFTGNYFWVNETTGSDGGPGTADQPFKTLAHAQVAATANNGDVVFVEGTIHTTATLNWAKDGVHLIGLTAPCASPRARISQTGSVLFTPLVNVTAQGCIFANLGTFHGFASNSAQVCWVEAGQRNCYSNVVFLGGMNATAAGHVGARSLVVGAAGQGENLFEDCVIGGDTVLNSGNSASLEFAGGSPRNTFRRCTFPRETSAAGAFFVTAPTGSVDRWNQFENCTFINNINSASTQMTVGVSMGVAGGGPNGILMMKDCSLIGATKWGNAGALGQMYVDGGAPTAATTGLAVNPS